LKGKIIVANITIANTSKEKEKEKEKEKQKKQKKQKQPVQETHLLELLLKRRLLFEWIFQSLVQNTVFNRLKSALYIRLENLRNFSQIS